MASYGRRAFRSGAFWLTNKKLFKSILKGSDDGVKHFEESCFRTLSIVQWLKLALSKGPHRASATPPPPPFTRRRKQSQFPKRCFLKKKHWRMDKFLKQDYSKRNCFMAQTSIWCKWGMERLFCVDQTWVKSNITFSKCWQIEGEFGIQKIVLGTN
jgi:hypothetical protein